ncbi:hypothetical protein THAOC_24385, partial [Thalassiosira oceanica]
MPTATKLRIPSVPAPSTADGGAADPDNALRPDDDAPAGEATSSARQVKQNIGNWTAEEHRLFLEGLERHGNNWAEVATHVGSRTVDQIRSHAQKYFVKLADGSHAQWAFAEVAKQKDANPPAATRTTRGRTLKPVAKFGESKSNSFGWSAEEDERLTELVGGYQYGSGTIKWREIAAKMPGRDSTLCMSRWRDHLDTSYNKSPFTADEDHAIARFQADEEKAGNWAELAEDLPGGRTANQIKQRWTRVLSHRRWEKKGCRADSGGETGVNIKHQLVVHEKLRGTSSSEDTTAKARRLADESARAKSGVVVAGEATTSLVHRQAKQNIGTWTAEEHRLFLEGLERHGNNWAEVATHVGSRDFNPD